MGIPGLTGGQVPGFSAKARGHGLRPPAPARGAGWPCSSRSHGHGPGPWLPRRRDPCASQRLPDPTALPVGAPASRTRWDVSGGHVARWSPRSLRSASRSGVRGRHRTRSRSTQPRRQLRPRFPLQPPWRALSHGHSSVLSGGHLPPRPPLPQLRGPCPAVPLPAAGTGPLRHAVLRGGAAGPALSSPAAMEAPEPPVHIACLRLELPAPAPICRGPWALHRPPRCSEASAHP